MLVYRIKELWHGPLPENETKGNICEMLSLYSSVATTWYK